MKYETKVLTCPTIMNNYNVEAVKEGKKIKNEIMQSLEEGYRIKCVSSAIHKDVLYNTYVLEKEITEE